MDTHQVVLGLGANLGDPVTQLADAIRRLAARVRVTEVSSVYRTEPVGHREQPDYLNLVCMGVTELSPLELLGTMQDIERELGRRRTFRNAPRPIDIDLLAYGDAVIHTPELTVPHPRLHERAFVLVPLVEIAPGWRHPRLECSAEELLQSLGSVERVERWGALPR